MFVRESLTLSLIGVAIGLAISTTVSQVPTTFLFGLAARIWRRSGYLDSTRSTGPTTVHLGDEGDRRCRVQQARVQQLWPAGRQHRVPWLVYHEVGAPSTVSLQELRRNAQHEHRDRVQRSSLQPEGVRPGGQPPSRRREPVCDSPGHRSLPQHDRAVARARLDGGGDSTSKC
jgi:hypothetical protein